MYSLLLISIGAAVTVFSAFGQAAEVDLPALYEPRDVEIFQEKKLLVDPGAPLPERVSRIAVSFNGVPYVPGILDRPSQEDLVLNLRQLDCWTFIEYSLALAMMPADGNFEVFGKMVQEMRYRYGVIDGYGSRLHYFSEWMLQAEKLGYLENITDDLGGIPYKKPVGYISARPARYPKINDVYALRAVRQAEARINAHTWTYIPKNRVAAVESKLREGDIILLTSAKRDLDIAHQGFALRRNGRIHLLHASSLSKRVVITAQPLSRYILSQRGQSGIMVLRIK